MALTSISPAAAAEDEVDIPDPAFRACLSSALNGRPLTAENLASLDRTTVSCKTDSPVRDLTGAEHLVNLQSLNLNSQAVTDLAPLSTLTSLRSLYLQGNPINSLQPVVNLDQLRFLDVRDVLTADFSPIASLPSLQFLYAGGNRPLTAFGALSQIENAVQLHFTHTGLTSDGAHRNSRVCQISGVTGIWRS